MPHACIFTLKRWLQAEDSAFAALLDLLEHGAGYKERHQDHVVSTYIAQKKFYSERKREV